VLGDPVVATAILDRLLHSRSFSHAQGDGFRARALAGAALSTSRTASRTSVVAHLEMIAPLGDDPILMLPA
jgi:hypothetical protein